MSPRIQYVIGDATEPHGDGPKIIAHCMNNVGAHDAGFALAVARKWPLVRQAYRAAYELCGLQLGECITCGGVGPALGEPEVVAMIAQAGLGPTSLRLPALGACLEELASWAIETNSSVHMPRIGCGLAGGKWEDVEPLILAAFNQPLASFVPVTVYDLPK